MWLRSRVSECMAGCLRSLASSPQGLSICWRQDLTSVYDGQNISKQGKAEAAKPHAAWTPELAHFHYHLLFKRGWEMGSVLKERSCMPSMAIFHLP